jgi:hypothetical protein
MLPVGLAHACNEQVLRRYTFPFKALERSEQTSTDTTKTYDLRKILWLLRSVFEDALTLVTLPKYSIRRACRNQRAAS